MKPLRNIRIGGENSLLISTKKPFLKTITNGYHYNFENFNFFQVSEDQLERIKNILNEVDK